MSGAAGQWGRGLRGAPRGRRAPTFLTQPPPQDHYDWGLRAIKSVLVVAGSLKRGDPSRAEDQVLMRALRDFNIPKIVTDDLPVFMGLIGDLFPALDVPRKRDLNFEKVDAAGPLGQMGASVAGAGPGGQPRRGAGGSHTARLPCREKHREATDLLPALAGTSVDAGGGGRSGGGGGRFGQTHPPRRRDTATPRALPHRVSHKHRPRPQQDHRVLAPVPSAPPACPSQIIKQSVVELKLQAEDSFVLKVVQLEELLQVRHSVFVIGNAGSGKSQVWPRPSAPPLSAEAL